MGSEPRPDLPQAFDRFRFRTNLQEPRLAQDQETVGSSSGRPSPSKRNFSGEENPGEKGKSGWMIDAHMFKSRGRVQELLCLRGG